MSHEALSGAQSDHEKDEHIVRDLVYKVDPPTGTEADPAVTWIRVPSVLSYETAEDGTPLPVVIPVDTTLLIENGVDPDRRHPVNGLPVFFWADVNVLAESADEVRPGDFGPSPLLTQADLDEFDTPSATS